MKKTILTKKMCIFAVLLLTMATLVACSKPDKVVSQYCEEMRELDFDGMHALTNSTSELDGDNSFMDEMPEVFDFVKAHSKDISYNIVSVKKEQKIATVVVDFTYTDAYDIVRDAYNDYIEEATNDLFSGKERTEQEYTDMLLKHIQKNLSSKTPTTDRATITFDLRKEGKEWKISGYTPEGELINVASCNIIKAITE